MIDFLKTIGLILISVVMLIGCSGSNGTEGPVDTNIFLTGTLDITGGQLADLNDPQDVGPLDEDKWSLRLIDPTESVDSLIIENNDASFTSTPVDPFDDYLLQVDFIAALDLSGGQATATPVQIAVPVSSGNDQLTTLALSIEMVETLALSSTKGVLQTGGYRLEIAYTISGDSGVKGQERVQLDWNQRRLRYDSDNDGSFDDESSFTDSDRNGISDNRQQALRENAGGGQQVSVDGVITGVDVEQGTITIDGETLYIVEDTVIKDSNGAVVTLDELEAGMTIDYEGRRGRFGRTYLTVIDIVTVE